MNNVTVVWPEGTYGLPKAITGCPKSGGLRWNDGWIELEMEDTVTTPSNISSNSQMEAEILPGGNVNRSFCIKKNVIKNSQAWPQGKYETSTYHNHRILRVVRRCVSPTNAQARH